MKLSRLKIGQDLKISIGPKNIKAYACVNGHIYLYELNSGFNIKASRVLAMSLVVFSLFGFVLISQLLKLFWFLAGIAQLICWSSRF